MERDSVGSAGYGRASRTSDAEPLRPLKGTAEADLPPMGGWPEDACMSPVPRGDRADSSGRHSSMMMQQQRPSYHDDYERDAYHEDDGVLRPSSPRFETAPLDSERARQETAELIEQQFLDGRAMTATPSGDARGNASSRDGQTSATGMSHYKQLWHFAYGEVCKQLGIKVSRFRLSPYERV